MTEKLGSMLDELDPMARLHEVLTLTPEPDAENGEKRYSGPSHWMPTGRVFGGQILAQAIIAANTTIEPGRALHSIHGYFLRSGDLSKPVHYQVEVLRDGRSFSQRHVQASQDGKAIFTLIASFQTPDVGIEHQEPLTLDVPSPEDLPTAASLLASAPPIAQLAFDGYRAFDIRHIPSPVYLSVEGEHTAHQAVWLKTLGAFTGDAPLQRAALAYASDYTILEPIFRRHGIAWTHRGLNSASLDHAMWFHRDARVDDWLLYVQESPTAQGGRGLAMGRIYNRQKELIATVVQEGMVRIPEIQRPN
ncbi:MAG TPA: acyl-CoA thioesterase II [Pseudoclavibacter sp.]|nr:acyl-CoA thioesterase II [Pseudoclavibacter sp.]